VETIRYRGTRHLAGPGSVLVLEPDEPHTGGPAAATGFAYRALYPRAELFGPGARFTDPVVEDPQLAGRLRGLHTEIGRGAETLAVESELTWILTALVGRHAAPGPPRPRGRIGPVAAAVRDRLANRLTDPPSLTELAADLGLSRYQVLRAFRAEMGLPPYAWLAQHRVSRARGLLATGVSPAEAAARVGFADQAHLTRWFRRVVGVTPGAFRAGVRGGAGATAFKTGEAGPVRLDR
jgi:AraC-like DNA-binding protein